VGETHSKIKMSNNTVNVGETHSKIKMSNNTVNVGETHSKIKMSNTDPIKNSVNLYAAVE
jgi:hypothetical protein